MITLNGFAWHTLGANPLKLIKLIENTNAESRHRVIEMQVYLSTKIHSFDKIDS